MNSNFLFVKNYRSNIANEEPDKESVGACFLVLALYLWKYRAVLELLLGKPHGSILIFVKRQRQINLGRISSETS